jgi:hypothetical protein
VEGVGRTRESDEEMKERLAHRRFRVRSEAFSLGKIIFIHSTTELKYDPGSPKVGRLSFAVSRIVRTDVKRGEGRRVV